MFANTGVFYYLNADINFKNLYPVSIDQKPGPQGGVGEGFAKKKVSTQWAKSSPKFSTFRDQTRQDVNSCAGAKDQGLIKNSLNNL